VRCLRRANGGLAAGVRRSRVAARSSIASESGAFRTVGTCNIAKRMHFARFSGAALVPKSKIYVHPSGPPPIGGTLKNGVW
jgi:hypothetical protein